jgi:murein L,D-transpeptidase YcbB/YkuD
MPGCADDSTSAIEAILQTKIEAPSPLVSKPGDQAALKTFYAARGFHPVWFDRAGPTRAATLVIREFAAAGTWGLKASDFETPAIEKMTGSQPKSPEETAAAEFELAALALRYATQARGGRIPDPAELLSGYLDRKPTLPAPLDVLNAVSFAANPGETVKGYHPQHEQFRKLHDLYVQLRQQTGGVAVESIALKGSALVPGNRVMKSRRCAAAWASKARRKIQSSTTRRSPPRSNHFRRHNRSMTTASSDTQRAKP